MTRRRSAGQATKSHSQRFGFAGCDSVSFGDVVNDLLVADRGCAFNPGLRTARKAIPCPPGATSFRQLRGFRSGDWPTERSATMSKQKRGRGQLRYYPRSLFSPDRSRIPTESHKYKTFGHWRRDIHNAQTGGGMDRDALQRIAIRVAVAEVGNRQGVRLWRTEWMI